MKEPKIFVLIVSRNFPKTHRRPGHPTHFLELINNNRKKHTIRGSYKLWKNRAELINRGEAILSIRYWFDKPYCSRQIEHKQLTRIGIQRFELASDSVVRIDGYWHANVNELAINDGLSIEDFDSWFQRGKKAFDGCIIHFTNFRY